jgi:plastocyanin
VRRRTGLVAALATLALPAAAGADTTTITMPGKYFDPPRSAMVAGDAVEFRNNDIVTHNVRIAAGAFDSGPIARFTSWSQAIDQPGGYPFVCTLHPFMSGNLDVVAATLATAPDAPMAGEPLTLSGRAPAGTARLGIEQSVSGGEWAPVGAGAVPAADGTFAASVPAVEGASYRVVTPAGASPAVTPRVTARVDVHLEIRHTRRHTIARVHTMPATTGFVATLERYARWRFRWRSERNLALDSRGRASFRLPARPRSFARVALRRTRRGPALVHSGVVKLRTGMTTVDPDAIAPHAGGGHDGEGHDGGVHG